MNRLTSILLVTFACLPCSIAQDAAPAAVPAATENITFRPADVASVRTEVLAWLASTGKDAESLKSATSLWADEATVNSFDSDQLLDLTIQSFAAADAATRQLLESSYSSQPPGSILFDGIRNVPFFKNQVRLFQARWLTQHRFYDDALPLLTEMTPDEVIDPAGLLFYRSICQAELLQRKEALDSVTLLLNNTLDVPQRFQVVARMLEEELAARKDDDMNQVGRLMKDVERRLELGNPNEATQKQGDAVIAAIDKLLDELDPDKDKDKDKNKDQNQGGEGQGSQQQQQSQQAPQEARIKGGNSEGLADRKNLSEEGNWGMLDKKKEAQARELIRRRLPANFLDQIGRFSRKLAEQK